MEKQIAKGFFLKKTGKVDAAFELQEFVLPDLKRQEVAIRVEAFGLNFADVMARRGQYRDAPKLPYIPGYDIVGEVVSTGSAETCSWIGKRVAAFCRFGGYSTFVNTPVNALVAIEDVPAGAALSLCTQGATASYMADLIHPAHREGWVFVHAAAGGVGSLLLQILQRRGFQTIAKVGCIEKAEQIQSLAPNKIIIVETLDYFKQLKSLLGNERLVASFNATGGKTIANELRLISSGGNLVLFGGAALLSSRLKWLSMLNFIRTSGLFSPIPLMMGSRGIIGVNMLRLADDHPSLIERHLRQCFQWYKEGALIPLKANEYNARQLVDAHAFLESGKSTGKVLVYWEGV